MPRHSLSRRIWSADVKAFNIVGYILVGLFACLCTLPFYVVLISSFENQSVLIASGYSLTIRSFTLENYRLCLEEPTRILNAYSTTIGVTLVGTLLSVFVCTMTGFVLSRKDFVGRNAMSFFFYFTTLFSGGLAPWYIICTRYLKFKNSYLGLVLPMVFSVWNMIISKNFMKSVPDAIVESAKIDGANDFSIYIRLILPVCKPLIATIGLFSALTFWNDWYNCMLFVTKEEMYTLQYYLQKMLSDAEALTRLAGKTNTVIAKTVPIEGMKMAMTVITTGPILLLYPFVQKYFVKGLTLGAVKG